MAVTTGIFNGITINGTTIPRPSDFELTRENVYAAELTTCTGKIIADCIGWRFADVILQWDYLTQEDLNVIMNLNHTTTISFDYPDGTTNETYTENVIIRERTTVGSRMTDSAGNQIWKDIQMGVSFINVHQYED